MDAVHLCFQPRHSTEGTGALLLICLISSAHTVSQILTMFTEFCLQKNLKGQVCTEKQGIYKCDRLPMPCADIKLQPISSLYISRKFSCSCSQAMQIMRCNCACALTAFAKAVCIASVSCSCKVKPHQLQQWQLGKHMRFQRASTKQEAVCAKQGQLPCSRVQCKQKVMLWYTADCNAQHAAMHSINGARVWV